MSEKKRGEKCKASKVRIVCYTVIFAGTPAMRKTKEET